MPNPGSRLLATRLSLLERLHNREDHAKWREFFDTYWRLIHGVARQSGLSDAEAQDVVQETVLSVMRSIDRYDPKAGSFRSWLLQFTRWRIIDQVRLRDPVAGRGDGSRPGTTTVENVPDPARFSEVWDDEWKRSMLEVALERLKRKVSAQHFQIFDCAVRMHWSVAKIAGLLRVNIAQVYLIKHRLARMLKKEIAALDQDPRGSSGKG